MNSNCPIDVEQIKPKRGRKPNKVVSIKTQKSTEPTTPSLAPSLTPLEEPLLEPLLEAVKLLAKKRGRKPKGGKLVQQAVLMEVATQPKQNIILHLKCCMNDLQTTCEHDSSHLEPFNFPSNKNDLSFGVLEQSNEHVSSNSTYANNEICSADDPVQKVGDDENYAKITQKETWRKIKVLERNLHANDVENKKSCCFWDTCEFDNPPVFIPKYHTKDTYNVYGCFCSPECATAFLMQEHIDSSSKFERYHLLNYVYGKINNYTSHIKPAPDPHYMLDRFCGNLSIQEYRSLLKKERLFLILDKPLSRILPELHEDNDDFILNNKVIPSNAQHAKKKQPPKSQRVDQFGLFD